jgi:hypothetical protein
MALPRSVLILISDVNVDVLDRWLRRRLSTK